MRLSQFEGKICECGAHRSIGPDIISSNYKIITNLEHIWSVNTYLVAQSPHETIMRCEKKYSCGLAVSFIDHVRELQSI